MDEGTEATTTGTSARLRAVAVRLGILLLSCGLTLGLCELVVRLVFPQYRAIQSDRAMWSRHDTLGWVMLSDIEVQQSLGADHRVSIRTNSLGFRDRETPLPRTGDRTRIVMLGDSYTFGFGVEEPERYDRVLERVARGVECVNLGVSGYSTDQELLAYRDYGVHYSPDVVVLNYVANDPLANASRLGHGHPKPRFAVQGQNLVLTNVPVPDAHWTLGVKYFLAQNSALYNLTRERVSPWMIRTGLSRLTEDSRLAGEVRTDRGDPYNTTITRMILRQLDREVRAGGAHLLVVLAFSRADLARNIPENVALLRWCEDAGLACIDTFEEFRAHHARHPHEPLFLPDRHHWSARGHRLVGHQIHRALLDLGWLPDRQPEDTARLGG